MSLDLRAQSKFFAEAHTFRSLLELFLALMGYFFSVLIIYITFTGHYWVLYLIACAVGSLFMVKVFALFHDCVHHSLFTSHALNNWVGRFLSMVIPVPFDNWRFEHEEHHSHVVDMEKIGHGDITLLTVEQFKKMSKRKQLGYRIFRHPLFLLICAPFLYFFINARFAGLLNKKLVFSVVLSNVCVLIIYLPILLYFGFWVTLFVFVPAAYFGGVLGVALFYVQHNYPDTQWFKTPKWEHEKASIEGSSLLLLPQPLEWFSHAIGYHHIHHLNSKIPGYRLRECYNAIEGLRTVEPLSWGDIMEAFSLRLWSYQKNALVTVEESDSLIS